MWPSLCKKKGLLEINEILRFIFPMQSYDSFFFILIKLKSKYSNSYRSTTASTVNPFQSTQIISLVTYFTESEERSAMCEVQKICKKYWNWKVKTFAKL